VDVLVDGDAPSEWVHRLDPALRATSPTAPSPVLVVHPLRALGARQIRKGRLRLASEVETLLDLYEMRLTEQAEEMVAPP
jgi:hypothetical protein